MAWVYRPNHPCADDLGMVEKHLAGSPPVKRSRLPGPAVITDQIEVRSMVDNEMYTSKAALRRSYREHGYVEVGNEELKVKKPAGPDRKAVRDSVRKAASRVGIPV